MSAKKRASAIEAFVAVIGPVIQLVEPGWAQHIRLECVAVVPGETRRIELERVATVPGYAPVLVE